MGERGLAQVCPLTVEGVVVADEDAVPVADEFREGFLGAVGVIMKKATSGPAITLQARSLSTPFACSQF
jgi:hypothetical protein